MARTTRNSERHYIGRAAMLVMLGITLNKLNTIDKNCSPVKCPVKRAKQVVSTTIKTDIAKINNKNVNGEGIFLSLRLGGREIV